MSAFPYPVTPTPPMFHCDYSDWSPSFYIIPSVYLLSFLVGCLGNSLVLWVYLHRTNARGIMIRDKRRIAIGQLCCSFRATHHDASISHHVSDRGNPSGQSYRPSSHAFSSSSLPPSIPRPSRSLTDSLIASLALADLCFLVTLPFWAAYTAMAYHWPFGQPLCQISSFLTALNMYASIFSLSMLSVERYWVLTGRRHSGHYPLQRCPNRTLWILIAVWTLAGILALPGLLRSVREVELDPKSRDDQGSFVLSCQMDYSMLVGAELDEAEKDSAEMWWAAVLSLKSTLIGFLLPLVILLICYCSLARFLSRHFGHGPLPDRRHQRRLLRVIITLVMAFFLCWLPLHVNKTISVLMEFDLVPYSCSLDQALLAAHPYVTCLAYLNSCLNPLLYAACDPSFRGRCRATLLMWCRLCREEDEGNGKTEVKERFDRSSNVPTRTLEETEGRTEDEEEEEDRL